MSHGHRQACKAKGTQLRGWRATRPALPLDDENRRMARPGYGRTLCLCRVTAHLQRQQQRAHRTWYPRLANVLNVAPATAARALQVLEVHGLIVVMQKGGFSRKTKHATEYRLTEFGCDKTGSLSSKDFAYWQKNTVHVVRPDGARHETVQCTS